MRRLADESFGAATFRELCARIGEPEYVDRWLWRFSRPDGTVLIVGAGEDGGMTVGAAVLSTCWWDTVHRHDAGDDDSYAAEQRAYDDAYDDALRAAEAVAGQPDFSGRDQGTYPHRWALWRGRTGLFVVQQSAYDLQFGVDVNYWVRPWTARRIEPTEPFIDWLSKPPSD